eukprot:7564316-Pyramimonas_sp.AAC.1
MNARELANRLYSKNSLWPGEDYGELLQKTRNNETFVRSGAYKPWCLASNGEAWFADELLQDSAKRPVLSAEYAIPNRATFFIARRDRTVSGEPRTIVDRI